MLPVASSTLIPIWAIFPLYAPKVVSSSKPDLISAILAYIVLNAVPTFSGAWRVTEITVASWAFNWSTFTPITFAADATLDIPVANSLKLDADVAATAVNLSTYFSVSCAVTL